MPKYWTIINTRIVYHAVVEVLLYNQPILYKLDNTNYMYIEERGLGITTYTTILLLLREQRRLYKKQHMSIDIATNPIAYIMGNLLNNYKKCYFLLRFQELYTQARKYGTR